MPKYIAPRADGTKAYVRSSYHFGKTTESIVWAHDAAHAKHMYARLHLERVTVRRATIEDWERLT